MNGLGEYNPSVFSAEIKGTDLPRWESVPLVWIKELFQSSVPSSSLSRVSQDDMSLLRGQAQGICTV